MRSSLTAWMKHAEHCGRSYATSVSVVVLASKSHAQLPPDPAMAYSCQSPRLNQTGELKAPYWLTSKWESSASNESASALVAKYPPKSSDARRIVCVSRCTTCLTLVSPVSLLPCRPAFRKY